MIFKSVVDINRPRQTVVELFADSSRLIEYQEGFIKKELISGTDGEVGTVSKIYSKIGRQDMELTETITSNNLPDSFETSYHHIHMDNTLKCTFIALNENQTRYISEGEYTAFRSFIPKMISIFFPGIYRKHAERWHNNFKDFVEKQP